MKRNGFLILLLFSFAIPVQSIGKDTTRLNEALRERLSPLSRLGGDIYLNPALRPYAWKYDFSTLKIESEYAQAQEAIIVQQGSGYRQGLFQAESHLHLKPHVVLWGNAGYQFGQIRSVQWNESSDFDLLFPYVMADSIGGHMNTESYTFCGGYAQTHERFSWGVSGDYRATIEYRKVDPRPRNVVSDLQVRGGISYRLNERYRLGTGLYGRIYRQRNSIKFFSDLGATKVYQMLGMGMYSVRFSGSSSGVQYDGGTIGGHLSLLPENRQGLFLDFGSQHFSVERTLLDHNFLPLTRIQETSFNGTIAWREMNTRRAWGLELTANHHQRKGTEYVYGESSGSSNFPKINELEQYQNQRTELKLQGVLGKGKAEEAIYWLKVHGGIHRVESNYLSPSLEFESFQYQGGLNLSLEKRIQKSFWHLSVHGKYVGQLSDTWNISLLNTESSIRKSLDQQYLQLISPSVHYGLSAQWNYPIHTTLALSIKAQWQEIRFDNQNRSNHVVIGCHLQF